MTADGPVLRDIHLPSSAWWPLAPGWWLVAVLALLLIAAGIWCLWRRARQRPLAAALWRIDELAAAFARDGNAAQLAEDASQLMRRVARKIDPFAASRSGEGWHTFVRGYVRDPAAQKALDDLLDARFRAHPVLDAPAVLAALRAWCRRVLATRSRRVRIRMSGMAAANEIASA